MNFLIGIQRSHVKTIENLPEHTQISAVWEDEEGRKMSTDKVHYVVQGLYSSKSYPR